MARKPRVVDSTPSISRISPKCRVVVQTGQFRGMAGTVVRQEGSVWIVHLDNGKARLFGRGSLRRLEGASRELDLV